MSYDGLSIRIPDGRMSPAEPKQCEVTYRCEASHEWLVTLELTGTDADEDGVYPVWEPIDEQDKTCNVCGKQGE